MLSILENADIKTSEFCDATFFKGGRVDKLGLGFEKCSDTVYEASFTWEYNGYREFQICNFDLNLFTFVPIKYAECILKNDNEEYHYVFENQCIDINLKKVFDLPAPKTRFALTVRTFEIIDIYRKIEMQVINVKLTNCWKRKGHAIFKNLHEQIDLTKRNRWSCIEEIGVEELIRNLAVTRPWNNIVL